MSQCLFYTFFLKPLKTLKVLLSHFLIRTAFIIIALHPSMAAAQCLRPYLTSEKLASAPTHAGLVLPIPTDLFSYQACPANSEPNCLMHLSINNGDQLPTTVTLVYFPDEFNLTDLINSNKAKVIARNSGNAAIIATAIRVNDSVITRIDHAVNNSETYMLIVNHREAEDYPQIEILQAFLRENIVVCGN